MAVFTVERESLLSAPAAWALLTDWPRHGRFVALTTVRVTTPPPTGVGTVFIARTALGRAGFDDPMEIVSWQPPAGARPGVCRIEKRGRVMLGWAELTVTATAGGSVAQWREDVTVARSPGFAARPTALSSRLLFGRVLRKLLET